MARYQVDLSVYYLHNMLLEVDADDETIACDKATNIATTAAVDFMNSINPEAQVYLDEITAWAVEQVDEMEEE